jgi:putative DNA primase/helicase
MAQKKIDFEELAARLRNQARELLPQWFPNGKIRGHEFVIGNLAGDAGESLSINLNTTKWADFADSTLRGLDLISLYAAIHNIKQGEAAKRLGGETFTANDRTPSPEREPEEHRAIGRPPAEADSSDFKLKRLGGGPSRVWAYRDSDGSLIGYVARYDTADGKELIPWVWDTDNKRWRNWSFQKPRPLYGLDLLAAKPEAPVLIVEGEKVADAARELFTAYVVVTWPGGGQATEHVDWRPLFGRRLLLWPDADRKVYKGNHERAGQVCDYFDQPGAATMRRIAARLHAHSPEVKLVDMSSAIADSTVPDGWDLADAAAACWTPQQALDYARPKVKRYEPAPVVNIDTKRREKTKQPQPPLNAWGTWDRLGLELSAAGAPISNIDNVLRVFEKHEELHGIVHFDIFHQRFFHKDGHEWGDDDELALAAWIQRACRFRGANDMLVHKAARIYALRSPTDAPRDWMDTLTWDGTERIADFFLDALGARRAPDTYLKAVSRNFWIAVAARVYRPGCKFDNIVVLEGGQGKLKSTALERIGGPWYTTATESVLSKDFYLALQGKLIVEIAELDSFTRADVLRIKQVLSTRIDRFRPPYARAAADFQRRAVFVGSTNEDAYLRDATGGRRFWPVTVGEIRLDLIDANREQLFAEAVHRFKAGASWWEMPGQETAHEQEARRAHDVWEDTVREWLDNRPKLFAERDEVTLREVLDDCLEIESGKQDQAAQKRVAHVLRVLGYRKDHAWHGKTRKVWIRADVEDESVN